MPRRPLLTLGLLAAVAAPVLTGCSDAVTLAPVAGDAATTRLCAQLYADLPQVVGGQTPRRVADDTTGRAWGDPAITLQCGVAKPDALVPTSQCFPIRGVGWLREDDDQRFTTIGRRLYVRVVVPDAYAPAADALADVADVVKAHDPVVRDCV